MLWLFLVCLQLQIFLLLPFVHCLLWGQFCSILCFRSYFCTFMSKKVFLHNYSTLHVVDCYCLSCNSWQPGSMSGGHEHSLVFWFTLCFRQVVLSWFSMGWESPFWWSFPFPVDNLMITSFCHDYLLRSVENMLQTSVDYFCCVLVPRCSILSHMSLLIF